MVKREQKESVLVINMEIKKEIVYVINMEQKKVSVYVINMQQKKEILRQNMGLFLAQLLWQNMDCL